MRDRVAIVTGASGPIGGTVARRLAAAGVKVIAGHLGRAAPKGRGITAVRSDVSSQRDVRKLFETAASRFRRLDILVNAAGARIAEARDADIEDLTAADWDEAYRTDVMGTILCCRHGVQEMRRKGSGAIVNFSSAAALRGDPSELVHSASKAGVDGFTRALARQVGPEIRVNAVAPGRIHAKGHGPRPEDVAGTVLYLVSDEARFVTGQTLFVEEVEG